MTKKDYILIAKVLKVTKPCDANYPSDVLEQEMYNQWELMVRAMVQMLSQGNGSFNFNTFYTACGLELVKK